MPRQTEYLATGPYLTVGELKAYIEDLPTDATIYLEGCDCYGKAGVLAFNRDTNHLTIDRAEGE